MTNSCLSFAFLSLKSSNTFRAVLIHCCIQPSLRKARCALLRTDGVAKILSPTRVARILDAILPNSWSTDMGRMSLTFSVHFPSKISKATMAVAVAGAVAVAVAGVDARSSAVQQVVVQQQAAAPSSVKPGSMLTVAELARAT